MINLVDFIIVVS